MSNINYGTYLVTDTDMCPREKLASVVTEAIKGGVTIVQLREKEISTRDFYNEALEVKKICAEYNLPLIINDRLDIALAVDADGIHVGQSDMPIDVIRRILGDDKLIGLSAGNVEEALEAVKMGADYLGVGAVFHTDTKKDAVDVGINMLKSVRDSVDIPMVGIGGINLDNIDKIYGLGIDGVAVVSCIMASDDPYKAAYTLSEKVKNL